MCWQHLGEVGSSGPGLYVEGLGGVIAANGINEHGDVVGWGTIPAGTQAFVYTDADGFVLQPSPAERPFSLAGDINDNSEVVGSAYIDTLDQPGHATRWQRITRDHSITDLGTLEGDTVSEARTINNGGTIVGYSSPNSLMSVRTFLYTDETGMVDMEAGGLSANAQDINEADQVTGYAGLHSFRWTAGGGTDILTESDSFAFSTAFAINDAGQVAGSLKTASDVRERIARYTDGTGGPGWLGPAQPGIWDK